MRKILILALPLVLLVAGCAHQISQKSLELADRTITFSKLRENPDAYRGKFVVLGGVIAAVKDVQEGTQIEVVQHDLDSREMPDAASVSGGRFLAITPDFLPVATCRPGANVTMAGEVAGRKTQPLKGVEYTYPVIVIKEVHFNSDFDRVPDENSLGPWKPYGP